ncbi:MAG: Uma2 family endonuclease [Armatimonadota bacterium]|nr:Uma2 family endonuclease [Armatimonadota bacterium]MDR7450673.1 Uma2 family endonuclease [Armatimonadota bacterium]MDR7466029.1 Uma2 family endonuclease [Armatimonadota bacterium]MDR7493934.1 Uma2 family endonuclease [Armatimonadota bacterium]MDR7504039.1 Uma2 family endonuclease [Armatimonadota bacterium]
MNVQLKRWTRAEYERLGRHGVLGEDDGVQLIDGEIVQMGPQGPAHAAAVSLVADALRAVCGSGYHVRVQLPLAVSGESEPEPDLAVVSGTPRDYRDAQPTTAVLVVEVAETTAEFDRDRKGPLYAGAGIRDYWVLDLAAAAVDVYRDPGRDRDGRPGYRSHIRLGGSEEIAPLAFPQRPIPVRELLP